MKGNVVDRGKIMHIVYVTGNFPERDQEPLGGMQNYIYKISKYMISRDHRVTILAIGKKEHRWEYDGVPVYTVPVVKESLGGIKGIGKYLAMILREWTFNKALGKLNDELPVSLVQYAGWYGVGMLYNRKFPSVLRISSYTKQQLASLHKKKETEIISFFERLAGKNFDGVIAPSKALGIPYAKDIKRKVTIIKTPYVIPSGIDEDWEVYRRKLKDKKYFLFFGRISPDKGIDTIAGCIDGILSKHTDFYFVFAGPAVVMNGVNKLKMLEEGAKENRNRVLYLGNLKHNQLNPVIRNAECVVLPSLMDNLPNSCLEAMALNGIVIGTRGASFDEIFEDGKSGLLMEIDNGRQLTEKIDTVVRMQEEEKEAMRLAAREELEKYNPRITGKELER